MSKAFIAQFVIFVFLVIIFFIFGIAIIRKRNFHFAINIFFGIIVLFFGFVPMVVTSSPFIILHNMDQDLIN